MSKLQHKALHEALHSGNHTLPKLLQHWARTTPDALAFREKDLGIWNRMSWRHYHDTARRFALGMLALGFRRGERLAIASEDTPEWMFADLGTQAIGGVVVGIYPTNPWPELQYIVHHSNSRFVVCGDQEQVDKVLDAIAKHEVGLPDVAKIIAVDMKGMRLYPREMLMSFEDVLELGDQYAAANAEQARAFDDGIAATQPDDTCMLVYTSGTTGPPKGAMLSHRNLLVTTDKLRSHFGLDQHNMQVLCYLPLVPRGRTCLLHRHAHDDRRRGELRRVDRHRRGQPARDRTDRLPGRAAHLGEAAAGHRDAHAGRHPAAALGLRALLCRGQGPVRARRAARRPAHAGATGCSSPCCGC